MNRAFLTVFVLTAACQSYETGIATVCSAPVDCADCMKASVDEREPKLVAHIDQRVRNEQTLALLKEIATIAPHDKGERLRTEASAQGISACPMADVFESRAKSGE